MAGSTSAELPFGVMWVLGYHGPPIGWHDGSVCLVDGDGKVVAFAENERFTRTKHALRESPLPAVEHCLAVAGITRNDIDVVAVGWDLPVVFTWLKAPWTFSQPSDLLKSQLGWSETDHEPDVVFCSHHRAHAACAFYASGYPDAAVLIVDGQGEDEATSIFSARYGEPIVRKDRWATPASIGYMYEAACQAIGLDFLEAGKTMGLASYGRAGHEADLLMEWDRETYRQPFDISDDATYEEMVAAWATELAARFPDLPRTTPRSTLHEDEISVRVAYSAQATVEDIVPRLVDLARTRVGTQNLCLGGGVGLNCSVNGTLAAPVYVPPVTYDAGVALGAAWLVAPPTSPAPPLTPFLGRTIGPHEAADPARAAGLECIPFDTDDVVRRLLDGKIGAIAWGRAEVGARALGHRSILALPNRAEVADQVNRIKSRELWRPLAPVGLPSVEGSYWAPHALLHKYMLGAVEVTDLAARTDSRSRSRRRHRPGADRRRRLRRRSAGRPPRGRRSGRFPADSDQHVVQRSRRAHRQHRVRGPRDLRQPRSRLPYRGRRRRDETGLIRTHDQVNTETGTPPAPTPESGDGSHRSPPGRDARIAGIAFAVVVAAAFPIYLIRGSDQWFFLDEWDFLAARRTTNLHDLFTPHNEHWSTIPIIVYRVLWHIVGLRTYVPYQLLIIALHLVAAILLWRVMRRARVQPFIAAAAAAAFVLLGSGREDIVWAFQIGFVGALVCGLAHLLLADHDGPFDRRDALGLAFGVAGLMCSGVAVTMTIVVGVAVLVRRGWRPAAFHVAPLGAAYIVWWLIWGRDAYSKSSHSIGPILRFVVIGVLHAFAEIGQIPGIGIALALLLVLGLVLTSSQSPVAELRRRYAAPGALLVGGLVFFVIGGIGRAGIAEFGPDSARAGRYVDIFAALALPAIAVAADAVTRRWRMALPALVVLLLVGTPGNIAAIRPHGIDRLTLGSPSLVEALAYSPYAARVPRSSRPLGVAGPEVTVGWLLDGAKSGRIPKPPAMTPTQQAATALRLALGQNAIARRAADCTRIGKPVDRVLRRGATLTFSGGAINVQLVTDAGVVSGIGQYKIADGQSLAALTGPLHLRLSRPAVGGRVWICA